mgnify:CR=1 FL=1
MFHSLLRFNLFVFEVKYSGPQRNMKKERKCLLIIVVIVLTLVYNDYYEYVKHFSQVYVLCQFSIIIYG